MAQKQMEKDIKEIKSILKKQCQRQDTIAHFSRHDIIISFFGALLVASGFIFKGNVLEISENLNLPRILLIVVVTILILLGEIYFIGYSRVRDKKRRPFAKFAAKRLVTVYSMCLFVGLIMAMLYNLYSLMGDGSITQIFKLVLAIAFPASIGATLTDLLKKF